MDIRIVREDPVDIVRWSRGCHLGLIVACGSQCTSAPDALSGLLDGSVPDFVIHIRLQKICLAVPELDGENPEWRWGCTGHPIDTLHVSIMQGFLGEASV